jgi:hypothetical protein
MVKIPKDCHYKCKIEGYLSNGILYGGYLSLKHKILSFKLPIFFYQEFNLISIVARARNMVVLLGVALATLTTCGSGKVTRVLGPNMRTRPCRYSIREMYVGDIVPAGRTAFTI